MKSLIGQALAWGGTAVAAVLVISNVSFEASAPTQHLRAMTTETASEPQRVPGRVELKAASNGHFHVRADVNGRSIPAMVDTGASLVVLTYEDAGRAGVFLKPSDFSHPVATANGSARVALVTLDSISIGDITVRNVPAAVTEAGRMQTTLLGMSFLSKLERVDMRDGVMVLKD
jgi:aspartyl protease family protein